MFDIEKLRFAFVLEFFIDAGSSRNNWPTLRCDFSIADDVNDFTRTLFTNDESENGPSDMIPG